MSDDSKYLITTILLFVISAVFSYLADAISLGTHLHGFCAINAFISGFGSWILLIITLSIAAEKGGFK